MKALVLVPALALLLTGCARYQYRVTEPERFAAQAVRKEEPVSMEYEPLRYEAADRGGRLALGIFNPTPDLLRLDGNRSYVIDPRGETHSLPARTIAPRSSVRLFLPPEPEVYRAGPSFSFGIGGGYGYSPFYPDFGYPQVIYHEPQNFYLDGPDDWDWFLGTVTVRLYYETEGKTNSYDHQFQIIREKSESR